MENEIIKLNEIIKRLAEEKKELTTNLNHIALYACQLRKELKEQRRVVKRRV